MDAKKEKIAITKNEKDCLRIVPIGVKNGKVQIKFSFFDESFIARRFVFNNESGDLLYIPSDFGNVPHEVTYHSSDEQHKGASILPKYKDARERNPISEEIIDLNLKQLIVPIPICRITVNKEPDKAYKIKNEHRIIDLTIKYNTTEIYIASADYDLKEMSRRFPTIVEYLFPITSIDYLVYGAGAGCMPIMQKMFDSPEPIDALESDIVGGVRFFYRTYELTKANTFFIYANAEYSQNNYIEFFNNIEYLELLATTPFSYKLDENNNTPPRPAYIYDVEHLKRNNFHKDYIKRIANQFSFKEKEYKRKNFFRAGVVAE